jgi:hypothetical protein
MPAGKQPGGDKRILRRARQLLAFAEEQVGRSADWVELHNALFGIGGRATALFPTEAERTALSRTPEFKKVLALMDGLPAPAVKEFAERLSSANGAISVRLPRSVHAALLAEAEAEGVSLNQLCLSKLVAQLRAVVERAGPGKSEEESNENGPRDDLHAKAARIQARVANDGSRVARQHSPGAYAGIASRKDQRTQMPAAGLRLLPADLAVAEWLGSKTR